MDNITLVIASEFSRCPGARFRSEGEFSGEEFRSNLLVPKIKEAVSKGVKLIVDLDGSAGYATSFIEESFGGLIRNDGFTFDELENVLIIKSDEDPTYVDDIKTYIKHAWEHR